MMPEESELLERRTRWWAQWKVRDFSWRGLEKILLDGPGEYGERNVQDYWRRDLETGSTRSDDELLQCGELVLGADGNLWHIAHLPLAFGPVPAKSEWDEAKHSQLLTILGARLDAARDRSDTWRDGGPGVEGRAQLQGIVVSSRFEIAQLSVSRLNIDASSSYWGEFVSFAGAISAGAANFDQAWFSTFANFKGAHLGHGSSFNEVTFGAGVDFDGAMFLGNAEFSETRFLWYAQFRDAQFLDRALFRGALFSDFALFTGAQFFDTGDFRDSVFGQHAGFSRTRWWGNLSFQNVKLHEDSTFDGLRCLALQRSTFWISVLFAIWAAVVFGLAIAWMLQLLSGWFAATALLALLMWCQVRPFVQLSSVAYFRRPWVARLFPEDAELERLIRELRSLTLICEASRNRRDAAKFARLELMATRLRSSTGPFERGVSCLYDWTAGYGESLPRPLISLVITTVAFTFIFWAWAAGGFEPDRGAFWGTQTPQTIVGSSNISSAFEFSARNVFRPFGVWVAPGEVGRCALESIIVSREGDCTTLVDENPARRLAVQFAATAQSIISIALIFLFGLALRRRFQVSS